MRKITKPDVKNESPEYWEKVLESHGLGERALGLQQDPAEDLIEDDPETIPLDEADDE